jgi:hypothetical protein
MFVIILQQKTNTFAKQFTKLELNHGQRKSKEDSAFPGLFTRVNHYYIYRNSVLRVMPMTCRVAPILSLE